MFTFSDKVKDVMNQRCMSLKDLGDRIGVNSSTLSKLLNRKTKSVTLSLLYDICNELDLEIQEVIVPESSIQHDSKRYYLKDTVDRIKYLTNEVSYHTITLEKLYTKYETKETVDQKFIDVSRDTMLL